MENDIKTREQLLHELTELRLQNAALKKSESAEKYRSLVENIRDVIYELDSQGVVLYISPAVRDLLGYDSAEIVGKKFNELAHKDDLSSLEEWFAELRKGREDLSDSRIISNTGELKWVRTKCRPIMEDGLFKGARGILIDVTAQRLTEEALRQSEEKYRLHFDNVSDILFSIDHGFRLLSISPSVEKTLGYKPEELEGKVLSELNIMEPSSLEKAASKMKLVLAGEQIDTTIYEYCAKDGTKRFGEVSASPLFRNDKVVAAICVSRDITERKRVEEALLRNAEWHRTILQTAMEGFWVVDMQGRLLEVNDSYCRISGYSKQELLAMRISDIEADETSHETSVHIQKVMIQGHDRFEVKQRRKDGIIIDVEVSVQYHPADGGRLVTFLRDITENKATEKALMFKTMLLEAQSETSLDGILAVDEEERVILFNKGFGELWKIPQHIMDTKDDAKVLKYASKLLTDPEEFVSKIGYLYRNSAEKSRDEIKLTDGRYVDRYSSPLLNANGQYLGRIWFFRDITERRQAEEALRKNKRQLDDIITFMPDATLAIDKEKRIIIWNKAIEKMTGVPAAEMIGKGDYAYTIPFYGKAQPQLMDLVFVDDENLQVRYPNIAREGECLTAEFFCNALYNNKGAWIFAKAAPLYDQSGKIMGAIESIRDVTERKWAAEELRKSEKRYRQIVETSMEGIWIIDEELRTTFVNQRLADMMGYAPEDMVGKRMDSFIFEEDLTDYASKMDSRRRGLGEIFERRFRQKDGTTIWNIVSSTALCDSENRFTGCFSMVTDITERKKAEEQLQHTLERLRRAINTTIQVMVSAVEVRDPYTSGHQMRATDLARAIATEMGLPKEKIDAIRMAGSIHDIGKISIPAEILSKPTKLSDIEFSLIKEHAKKGYEMLKDVESPWPLAEIVYQHHERMDGSGYPRNLRGKEILLEARILNVADVVEAMASHRPYRPGLGIDAALNEIEKNSGTLYDKTVAEACLRLFKEKGFKLEGA